MSESTEVPNVPKVVNATSVEEDSLEILSVVRPQWFQEDGHLKDGIALESRALGGGVTNKLYAFSSDKSPGDVVIIKIYGINTDRLIDRPEEVEILKLLNAHNCGPALYATFSNGLCYEFLTGVTLTVDSVRSPQVFPLMAPELARMHKTVPCPPRQTCRVGESQMWAKMRIFRDLYKEIAVENPDLKDRLEQEFHFTVDTATRSIDDLERILTKEKRIPVALCHNDLVLGNVIYNGAENKVTFIDFEYAMPNYVTFDIANHFVEFAGLDNPKFETSYPNLEFRRAWIAIYLKHFGMNGFTLEEFEHWVDLCVPATHLFWALWAAVQAHYSDIDFDYAGYAGLRLEAYEKCMARIRKGSPQQPVFVIQKHFTFSSQRYKNSSHSFVEKASSYIDELEKLLKVDKQIPLAFCHNDLLLGNIVYNQDENKVTLIDFEYALPNYVTYDIANHFTGFAGVNNPKFEECYPTPEYRRAWIAAYLNDFGVEGFTQEEFERWVELCRPASHLHWGLWAAVQSHLSDLDFDYPRYSGLRLAAYETCVARILKSSQKPGLVIKKHFTFSSSMDFYKF